ncbi:hypothetical protein ACFL3X_01060 [Gemmatimonadota bacterium]
MKQFIVIYHASPEALAKTGESTPEEMEKGMEPWMEWAARCGDKLVDIGAPLVGGERVLSDAASDASTRGVCGYSVLQAENMEEAKTLLQDHPHLGWTGG